MFGVSLGEVLLIAVVALVVFDPRRLPEVLGTLGKWIARLRRVTTEMRRQTGIDEILRQEGFSGGIAELRSMLRPDMTAIGRLAAGTAPSVAGNSAVNTYGEPVEFDRYREYPTEGPDAYGTIAEDLLDVPSPPGDPPVRPAGTDGSVAKEAE